MRSSQPGGKTYIAGERAEPRWRSLKGWERGHPVQSRGEARRVVKPRSEGEWLCQTHSGEGSSTRDRLSGSLSLHAYVPEEWWLKEAWVEKQ